MKTKLARIIIAAILLVAAAIIDKYAALTLWQTLLVYLVPYLTVGLDVIAEAVEALIRGKAFNEDLRPADEHCHRRSIVHRIPARQ